MISKEISLYDNETLDLNNDCEHSFSYQANVNVSGIIWDIYYCSKCLTHVKKERPCPMHLEEIKAV